MIGPTLVSDRMLSAPGKSALKLAVDIGRTVVGPNAESVDRDGRFPMEAVEAMRSEGLLGAIIPRRFGGLGCNYVDLSALCTELGKHCASSAMVFAMHSIQVACIVEHCEGDEYFEDLLRRIATEGRLLASATTEAGVGGDVRSSICSVERQGHGFSLIKNASVISYGEYADDILVTARAHPEASASDQVLVHVTKPNLSLTPSGNWNAFGMRGTCSIGFELEASGSVDQILPVPYAELSAGCMLPVSHITWASLWLGIAEDAVARARHFVRAAARKQPGTIPPGARHVAKAFADLERVRAIVECSAQEYDQIRGTQAGSSMAFAIRMNNLKLSASEDVIDIIRTAMLVCGISGYREDTPYSLGRHLRDACSSVVMVHNDRLIENNAALLCLMKDD